MPITKHAVALLLAFASGVAGASGITGATLEKIVVTAERIGLGGNPRAASEGTVLREQLENRPLLRTAELLEVVPGLVVTQHTGDGKANQYFLRGFNLDHGTDFASRVEGMPVNLPTHAHGQGYTDLNFVIPELVERVVYHKGTYYPELGNFSAAGAAEFRYRDVVAPFALLAGGEHEYRRAVAAGSTPLAGGHLLLAAEHATNDGPWHLPQDLRRTNGVVRFSNASDTGEWSVDLMAYDGEWTATDQIPLRAVKDGRIGRFGFVDPSNGGETRRVSLSTQGYRDFGARRLDFSAWAMDYRLQLFSNFTYALDRVNDDQFEQFDDRRAAGGSIAWSQPLSFHAREITWRIGAELRHDDLAPIGLYLTTARERHATVREDSVQQTLAGLWTGLETRWTSRVRTEIGARYDVLAYDVASDLSLNSGSGSDTLFSPKLSTVFGPWRETKCSSRRDGDSMPTTCAARRYRSIRSTA